jgi:hypothetical protein
MSDVIDVTNTTRAVLGSSVIGAKMPVMTSAWLATLSLLLCGCSLLGPGKPDALDMGGGRYSVTGTTVSTNLTSARQDAAEQANAFCARSSRQAVIQNFDDFAHGGHWGGPTSSAVFYCR